MCKLTWATLEQPATPSSDAGRRTTGYAVPQREARTVADSLKAVRPLDSRDGFSCGTRRHRGLAAGHMCCHICASMSTSSPRPGDYDTGGHLTDTAPSDPSAPVVFISYAWESDTHADWVEVELATRLRAEGCDVRLDRWEALPGDPLTLFMESAIRESRHVLVVCTPAYKVKMDGRQGGVGYEGNVMTGELFGGKPLPRKFIPVVRAGEPHDAIPSWLLDRFHVDLRGVPNDHRYEREFGTLVGTLHGYSPVAPPLGPRPMPLRAGISVLATQRNAGDPSVIVVGDRPGHLPLDSAQIRILTPPIFGRDAELETLHAAVDAIAANTTLGGRAILLSGVSGIGKTTIAESALNHAASVGLRVVRATCEAFHEGMTFYPVRECLRQLTSAGGLTTDVELAFGASSSQLMIARLSEYVDADPSARRDALIATFTNQILARSLLDGAPVVLFIDDLERIDTGSVDALLCLLARLREGPVLVIGAYRSDVVPASGASTHPLHPVLSAARRADSRASFIELGVLPEGELSGLVATLMDGPCDLPLSFIHRLFEETEGNPLYVREALRTLSTERPGADAAPLRSIDGAWRVVRQAESWEIPRSIDDAIASRLVSLAEFDRAVLEHMAVLGRRFRFEVLAELGTASEDDLIQAIERQLATGLLRELRDSDNLFEFTHGKIRDVLYTGMSGLRRGRLHGQVADILVRRGDLVPSEQRDVVLGVHLFAARRYAAAAPHLLNAGERALELHSPLDATQHFRRALEALEKTPDGGRDTIDRVRLRLGVALRAANEFVAAEAQFLLVLRDGNDAYAQRWSLNHLGDVSLLQGRVGEALERYERCERLAREYGDNELLAETAADLAELHMRQAEQLAGLDAARAEGHTSAYVQYLNLEQELAESLVNRGARARAYRNAAKRQRTLGNLERAIELYERSLTFVDAGVDSHQFLIPYAKALRLVDRRSDALRIVRRVLDWSRQIGARRSEAIARQYLGLILMEQGLAQNPPELDAASDELSRAVVLHQEVGFEQGRRETEVDLAELASHIGNREDTVTHLSRAFADINDGSAEEMAIAILAQLRANGESVRVERFRRAMISIGIVGGDGGV